MTPGQALRLMLEPDEGLEPSSAQPPSRVADHGMAVGVDEADQVGSPEPQLATKLDIRNPVLGPQPRRWRTVVPNMWAAP